MTSPTSQTSKKIDIISPALLPKSDWGFDTSQLIALALGPPPPSSKSNSSSLLENTPSSGKASDKEIEEVYAYLFEAGVKAAKIWAETTENLKTATC